MTTRRELLINSAALGAGAILAPRANARTNFAHPAQDDSDDPDRYASTRRVWEESNAGDRNYEALEPGLPGQHYQPTITPGGGTAPFRIIDGVKLFHLTAEEVDHEFAPGLRGRCWGYNGGVHGPTIEAVEGDRIRIYVTNHLPAPTTIHWHGVYFPNGMDGVGGLTQRTIRPGETFKYEWTVRQHGTFMYHSHHDEMTQMAMGLMGMLIFHPRDPHETFRVDRDFVILLSEWKIEPGTWRPDPNEMNDFNVLTMNAKAFPGTAPLVAKLGDRVRIRFGNLSAMDHHPIHLHGHYWKITATDGGQIPPETQWPETTVLVPVGSTRDVEFIASEPGDWAMHCHMTHHVMNQMGHGIPNMVGMDPGALDQKIRPLLPGYMTMGQEGMHDMGEMQMPWPDNSIPMVGAHGPFDYITMGGMFSIVKIREQLESYDDPGWYEHPAETVAGPAEPGDLRRDGIST